MHFLAKNIKTEIVLVSYCLGETAHLRVSGNIVTVCIKFVKNVHGHTVIKLPAVKVSKSQNFFLKFSFEPKTNENMFVFLERIKSAILLLSLLLEVF